MSRSVRRATEGDIPHILRMCRAFHAAGSPPWPYSEADTIEVVRSIINGGFAAVSDDGFILGVIGPNPVSQSWVIAKEFLWWSEGKSGPALLAAFRRWAKERGANEIHLSCPVGADRVQRAYRRHAAAQEIVFSEIV